MSTEQQDQVPPEDRPPVWLPRWVAIGLITIVTAAWVANVVVGYFDPARASLAVNAAFTAVLGLLLSNATGLAGRLRRRSDRAVERERPAPRQDGESP